jgi:glycosyltransferase involved in cell wall biosynthesis
VNILLLCHSLPPVASGGAEEYVHGLAGALRDRGHVVGIGTGTPECVPDGVEALRLPARPALDGSERFATRLWWHARDQWRPAMYRALKRASEQFAPDVIHSHEVQGMSAAVFAAGRVPHVHTTHDFNLLCARTTMTRNGLYCGGACAGCVGQRLVRARAASRRISWLVAPSQFVLDRHLAFGVGRADASSVIPQGALPGRARQRAGRIPLRVGYMGTVAPHKGVKTLITALLEDPPPRWTLHVAGRGALDGELARLHQSGVVEYWGHVHADRKEDFLAAIDVLVIPSEWEENAPLVAVEAAVRGIPCVVTDRGGLPEGPHAWVVRWGAPTELRRLLDGLESNRAVATASAALLADRASYSWNAHVDAVEAVLHAQGARS